MKLGPRYGHGYHSYDHLPPSLDALQLHWLRTTWVVDYWDQATKTNINLLPLDGFGWKINDSKISIEWDSPENIQQVRNRVAFLTHGCKCKTGCITKRCKCFSAERPCGPGCGYSQCKNVSGEEGIDPITMVILILFNPPFPDATLTVHVSESESDQSDEGK